MFLSIIIPVYNAEKYLTECLDSCISQDIPSHDYEIICVNDGSTDGSGDVLLQHQEKYDNIVVISQSNAGVSAARNAGIDAARGDYIWFIDADDFIEENILLKLYKLSESSAADRIAFEHYEFNDQLTTTELFQKQSGQIQPNATPAGYLLVTSLYKRSIIIDNDLRFRLGISYAEDGLFDYEFNYLNPSSTTLNNVIYYYRRNNTSATRSNTQVANRKRIESAYQVAKIMIEYAKKDKQKVQALKADYAAGILMPDVRIITTSAAALPQKEQTEILRLLSANGLFPLFLYRNPLNWFPKKIHMNTAYKGFIGTVLDILKFYSTTRIGFFLLSLYYKIYKKLKCR